VDLGRLEAEEVCTCWRFEPRWRGEANYLLFSYA